MEQLTKLPLQDAFMVVSCSEVQSMSHGLRQGRDFALLFQIEDLCEALCFFYVDWIDRGKEELRNLTLKRIFILRFFPSIDLVQFSYSSARPDPIFYFFFFFVIITVMNIRYFLRVQIDDLRF